MLKIKTVMESLTHGPKIGILPEPENICGLLF